MKKSIIIIIVLIIIAAAGYFIIKPKLENKKPEFTYTSIKKGTIETIVSSTGALEAINTVEVGTQISGTISKIYVDYNDKVRAGQLLAEMDLKMLNTNLSTAQANLGVNLALVRQAEDVFERNKILYNEKVISEQEFNRSKFSYEQALSSKKAAESSVKNINNHLKLFVMKSLSHLPGNGLK